MTERAAKISPWDANQVEVSLEIPVRVSNRDEWKALVADIEEMGAAMVEHGGGHGLRPGLVVQAVFSNEAGEFIRVQAEVIHLYEGKAALGFGEAEKKAVIEAEFERSKDTSKEAGEEKGTGSSALWKRYETLNKMEKIKMARQGNADARRRVLKDRDPSLHLYVLQNPGLQSREISGFVRSGFVNPELLKRIVARKDIIANHDVVDAIIHNPHTPIPIAVSLLPRLRVETVRRIAKQGRLRDAIVKAARKRVITR